MPSRRRTLRRNGWESLEPRHLLAGDVFVSVAEGHLLLRGDDAANQVAVWGTDNPGEVRIQGLAGTRLVGAGGPVAENALVVNGVSRHLTARLGGGDDLLQLDQLALTGTVRIDAGFGDDTVLVGVLLGDRAEADATGLQTTDGVERLVLGGNLLISGSYGDDVVEIGNVSISGRLEAQGQFGNDRVALGVPSEFAGTGTPATGTLSFASPGSAASGTLTLSSGDTLNISAASPGRAFDDLTVVITDAGSGNSATYDAGTNTVNVTLDITGGDTTADLRSLISSLAQFNATSSGSAALQAGDESTFSNVTSGGADAGSDVITIAADDGGAIANGVTVTVLEAAGQGTTPSAAFNGSNIEVTLDDTATTAIAAIAAAIDALAGYSAAITTATGRGVYVGASSSPPAAATLSGGGADGASSFELSGAVRIQRDVFALLGWGDDQFQLDRAIVEGGLFVDAGWGNDQVAVGVALAELGNGPLAALPAAVAPRATINGAATVHGGWGDDDLRVVHAEVGGRLSVEAGFGDDNVALGRAITPAVQGGAAASDTLTFAFAGTASSGTLTLASGDTIDITAAAVGTAFDDLTINITDANTGNAATYDSGTNTVNVTIDITGGDTTATLQGLINGLAEYSATTSDSAALQAGDETTFNNVTTGGAAAGNDVITITADDVGTAANGVTVTIIEANGQGPAPTAAFNGSNIEVTVDDNVATTVAAIAAAIHGLAGYSAAVTASLGSGVYFGASATPPPAATLSGGGAAQPTTDDPEYSLYVSGALDVGLGAGDDVLAIRNAAVGGAVALPAWSPSAAPWISALGRRGAKLAQSFQSLTARLARERAMTATVRAGSGDDQVQIVDSAFHQLAVGLDNGDDALLLDGVQAALARLHGGSGVDSLTTTERNAIERQTAQSFATNAPPAAAAQTSGPVLRRRRR